MDKPLDTRKIKAYVHSGRYREAFEEFPETMKRAAIANAQEGTRQKVRELSEQNPWQFQQSIINELSQGFGRRAAILLAAHLDNEGNLPVLPAPLPTPRRQEREASRKPPYYPMARIEERDFHGFERLVFAFPIRGDRIAQEVFRGGNARLNEWIARMNDEKHKVPEVWDMRSFAEQRAKNLQKRAESKLKQTPPLPLSHDESNAHFYFDRFAEDQRRLGEYYIHERNFGHVIEYIILELLQNLKGNFGVKRVLKTSDPEDIFRGADIVLEMASGHWYGIDLTTAKGEEILRYKREKERQKSIFLPNLKEMLVKEGELEENDELRVSPLVQEINRDLISEVALRYIESLKRAGTKSVVEIFREVSREQKKNPEIEIQNLLDLSA